MRSGTRRRGGQRIARVVKDLSTFGRPDPRRTGVRPMDVVDEAVRFLPAAGDVD